MHITQWGEYGIQCSAFIAEKERQGASLVSATEVAQAQGIPLQYAQQILHRLKRNNVIESVRGPHGGYRLKTLAATITLHDILLACEGNTFDVICETKPLNSTRCSHETPCNLRPVWFKLREHLNTFLKSYTLDDLRPAATNGAGVVQISMNKQQAVEQLVE